MIDRRGIRGPCVRKATLLPLSPSRGEDTEYCYEVQISVLITGIDDWVWTSYCLVETYHGGEPSNKEYLNSAYPTEPATAGSKHLEYPIWNPREFFLCVLKRRIAQAVGEYRVLNDELIDRMNDYVSLLNELFK